MTGSNTGKVLGASTTIVGGAAALHQTSGELILAILGIVSIIAGVVVIVHFFGTRIYKRFIK